MGKAGGAAVTTTGATIAAVATAAALLLLLMLSVSGWGCCGAGGAPVKKEGGRKYTRYPPLLPSNRLSSLVLPPPADHEALASAPLRHRLNHLTSLSSDASFHPFLYQRTTSAASLTTRSPLSRIGVIFQWEIYATLRCVVYLIHVHVKGLRVLIRYAHLHVFN